MQRRFYKALAGLWIRRHRYPVTVREVAAEALAYAEEQVAQLQNTIPAQVPAIDAVSRRRHVGDERRMDR